MIQRNVIRLVRSVALWALLVPGVAQAQTYPSPTFQNLTVLGTITGTAGGTTDISGANVTATGGTTARALQDRFAERVNAKDKSAKGDTITYGSGAATGAAFTGTLATFTAADVGKYILIHGAGASGAAFTTTISAFVSTHAVTLAAAVTTNVTAASFTYGTDDTSAVAATIAAASGAGSCAYFPRGSYWLASQTASIALANVCIIGDGSPEFGGPYTGNGSVFLISNTTTNAFTPGFGIYWKGITVYYPAQDGSAATPIAFPPLFEATSIANATFTDSVFVNPYQLLKIDNSGAGSGLGRVSFTGVGGYCIDKCFWFLNGAADVLALDATDQWHAGWYQDVALTGNKYLAIYTATSGEFIRIDNGAGTYTNVDGILMAGGIVHGYRYGIRILSGQLDVSTFTGVLWDAVSTVLSVEGTGTVVSTSITGGTIYSVQSYASGAAAAAYNTMSFTSSTNNAELSISGVAFAYSQGDFIFCNALTFRNLTLKANSFRAWGQSSTNSTYYAVVFADGGGMLLVSSNIFDAATVSGSFQSGLNFSNVQLGDVTANVFNNMANAVVYPAAAGKVFMSGNASQNTLGGSSVNDTHSGTAVLVDTSNSWDKPSYGSAVAGFSGNISTASAKDAIVARAGGGQGSATLLTSFFNRVATVASAADSIKLPVSVAGLCVAATNGAANSMQVFGSSTDTINDVATATGVAVAAGKTGYWCAPVAGKWYGGTLN